MKYLLPLLFILMLPAVMHGQHWKTVSTADTTYFSAGVLSTSYDGIPREDSNFVRFIWVDSARAFGPDSIFYFYKGLRRIDTSVCIDTAAPSWLGSRILRTVGGVEYYFNSKNDTLTFLTLASPGTSWVIGKDVAGKVYKGTVTTVAAGIIDGVADSIKTITIQAYLNNVPVADWYNSFVFQLSKAHGWVKTLDLFRFPNKLKNNDNLYLGTLIDSAQHTRLPYNYMRWDLLHVDLANKYAAGNEIIGDFKSGIQPYPGCNRIVRYDSVISATIYNTNYVSITYTTSVFANQWTAPQGVLTNNITTQTYTHTDTIHENGSSTIFPQINGDLKYFPVGNNSMINYFNRAYADTLCNMPLLRISDWGLYGLYPAPTAACISGRYSISGCGYIFKDYLKDFGLIKHVSDFSEFCHQKDDYHYDEIVYAKTPNCTWGTKFNVIKLAVTEPRLLSQSYTVYPNPANTTITISPRYALHGTAIATIYAATGKLILQQTLSKKAMTLSTSDISAGLYFIEIVTGAGREMHKVVIQH